MAGLVEQFERANVVEVSFTGGEPFLRKDLLDLIRLLAQKKIRLVQIYSNGLLITHRHLASIRRIGFRPSFQISFDGVGAHDQMRGTKGAEPGVIKAIRRLRAADFPVVVSTCIDKLNIGSLADTYELMKRLDVQGWRISAPQETGNWRGTTTATPLDEQAEVCAPLLKRWIKDGQPFSIQLCGLYHGPGRPKPRTEPAGRIVKRALGAGRAKPWSRQGATGLKRPPEMPEFTPDAYDCGTCREQPNLLPDGTLVPCPGYVDSILQDRMPNLLRQNLSKVWTRSFLREITDLKKKDLLAKNPECVACDLFKECGAGCRASALTTTGNLMAKDPIMCELHKKGYKKRFRAGLQVPESPSRA
jgi:radical SAM protein with 4Fe4S-binding SPASM domain